MSDPTLIRGGTVVDGTGAPSRTADVLVQDGVIVEVGKLQAPSATIVDADGLVVTPGWVDIHTHYEGQVYWDALMTPSSWHGATTAVMGNCGVGFAPARAEHHEDLIGLMHKIEDIPAETLRAGIPWGWETFDQYLDCLDQTPRAIDVGALVPHGAVRSYLMRERGLNGEATPEEIGAIAKMIGDAIDAGALGCSGNRGTHGGIVPGSFASDEEMLAIANVVGSRDAIYECNPNSNDRNAAKVEAEFARLRRMSMAGNLAVTFPLVQYHHDPDRWRRMLGWIEAANGEGARMIPQVLGAAVERCDLLGREPSVRGSVKFQGHRRRHEEHRRTGGKARSAGGSGADPDRSARAHGAARMVVQFDVRNGRSAGIRTFA
jgi:N-acyl-D-aspartate/D-glutamate deacylase